MPLPINPTTESLLQQVPQTLLERFHDRGSNLEILLQQMAALQVLKRHFFIKFEFDRELDLLVGNIGDFRNWSENEWLESGHYDRENVNPWTLTPPLYLAFLGNTEFISWLFENKRDLLKANLAGIAHCAAATGNLNMLRELYQYNNQSLDFGFNIAHIAAEAGKIEILDFVAEKAAYLLLESKPHPWIYSEEKENLAHFAARSGNCPTLDWVFRPWPELFDAKLPMDVTSINSNINEGFKVKLTFGNAAHLAAASGSANALDWFFRHKPQLLAEDTTIEKKNIAHFAAESGNAEALAWTLRFNPALINTTTDQNKSILHFAVSSQSKEVIQFLLVEFPEFTKKLFADEYLNIRLAHEAIMHNRVPPTFHFIARDELLLLVTKNIMQQTSNDKEKKLLEIFKDDWQQVLITSSDYDVEALLQNIGNFPQEFREVIAGLPVVMPIKKISFQGEELTKEKFNQLLAAVKNLYPALPAFFKIKLPDFLLRLNEFSSKLQSTNLTPSQITCLKIILKDYESSLLGEKSDVLDLLKLKLSETSTLFVPKKPNIITDNEFRERSLTYSRSLKERVMHLLETEYFPYAEVMFNQSQEEAKQIDHAYNFLINRHSNDLWNGLPHRTSLSNELADCLKELNWQGSENFTYAEIG